MIDLFRKLFALLEQGTLPVMLPLVLTCFGIGVLIVNRYLYLYDPRGVVAFFWPPTRRRLRAGRDAIQSAFQHYAVEPVGERREQLLAACRRYRTPYSRFLERLMVCNPRSNARDLQIDRAALEEQIAIERGMQLLSTCAKAAPLMGLTGTVTGMIATFTGMMFASTSDPRALSAGISIALIATNVGLVVSLPGVIGMGWLSRRGKTLQEEIHLASMQLRGSDPFQD